MEGRDVPSAPPDNLIAIPFYGGRADAAVELVDATYAYQRIPTITPFVGYRGAVVAATGDVNRDGVSDVIVGAQAPNGHVKVFDGASGNLLQSFFSFAGFNGAVHVGSADVNGDHFADILVTANGINGHVKAFSGQDGALLSSFLAFPGFLGDTSISGADFNHDGFDEIVVGAGAAGVGGRVALFNTDGSVFNPGFFAFPGFNGGINVAAGDVSGDGVPDIVASAGQGVPGGHVKAFSGTDFAQFDSFVPHGPSVTTAIDIRLADANLDGRRDILVFVASGRYPSLTAFDGLSTYLFAVNTGELGSYSFVDVSVPSSPSGNGSGDYSGAPGYYGYDDYYDDYYDYPPRPIGGPIPDFDSYPPPDFGSGDPYYPDSGTDDDYDYWE